ncbi:hypothetical protein [Pseudodesulfovibrio piezophilus]|uniref:Uncharacterized protein n=1 Tax=Pseudodesulfovibrio piezophilus (strain DSM 21447 / JCM 15486 / C1TLV30) TaxID=1322246 RepID=M1WSP8_PSEP2|nr:hypothetical protein [Pseudodesulfovibrio piezophilus]CCH50314.1 protein of unknown function [Pseudodesulfovibrio piezophilus C1TLV30]
MEEAQVILADGTEFFIDKNTYDEHERTVKIYAQHNGGERKEIPPYGDFHFSFRLKPTE